MSAGPVVADPTVTPSVPTATSAPVVHRAHHRPLGIHPVPLLGALAALALLLAIILLAVGSLVAGLIMLGIAVASFSLFAGGVRREPDAPAGRVVLRTTHRARALAGLIAVALRAWARAALDLIRIRGRQQRLRRSLKANLAPLGEAVHQDDQQRAQALKQKAAEIDQQLTQAERDASAVIVEARRQIEHERSTIEPTQALARPQAEQAVEAPPDGASNGHIRQARPRPGSPHDQAATRNRRAGIWGRE
ncbi:MAG TPA: hypothetical protein VJ741_02835 [Solirubrobacteraceae bacterium]|nr:hypothetical protein [Solirubrobacteraceae bacterium]